MDHARIRIQISFERHFRQVILWLLVFTLRPFIRISYSCSSTHAAWCTSRTGSMNFLSSYPTHFLKENRNENFLFNETVKIVLEQKSRLAIRFLFIFGSFMALSKRRLWTKLSKWDTDQDTKFRDGQLSDRFVIRIFCRTRRHVSSLRYCDSVFHIQNLCIVTSLISPPLEMNDKWIFSDIVFFKGTKLLILNEALKRISITFYWKKKINCGIAL